MSLSGARTIGLVTRKNKVIVPCCSANNKINSMKENWSHKRKREQICSRAASMERVFSGFNQNKEL